MYKIMSAVLFTAILASPTMASARSRIVAHPAPAISLESQRVNTAAPARETMAVGSSQNLAINGAGGQSYSGMMKKGPISPNIAVTH